MAWMIMKIFFDVVSAIFILFITAPIILSLIYFINVFIDFIKNIRKILFNSETLTEISHLNTNELLNKDYMRKINIIRLIVFVLLIRFNSDFIFEFENKLQNADSFVGICIILMFSIDLIMSWFISILLFKFRVEGYNTIPLLLVKTIYSYFLDKIDLIIVSFIFAFAISLLGLILAIPTAILFSSINDVYEILTLTSVLLCLFIFLNIPHIIRLQKIHPSLKYLKGVYWGP